MLAAKEIIEGKGGGMQNTRSNSLQIEDHPIFGRHAFSRQKRSYNIVFVHADKCLQKDMERKCKNSNGVKNAMHDLHNSSVKRRAALARATESRGNTLALYGWLRCCSCYKKQADMGTRANRAAICMLN